MSIRIVTCAVALAIFAAAPSTAYAQCGMGHTMGSAHDHGSKETAESATKHDKVIRKLLADRDARARLFDMLVADEALFREFLGRGLETERGRRVSLEVIQQVRVGTAPGGPASEASPDSADSAEVYQCPMHPEIVSSIRGSCPKCGMALEQVGSPTAP